MTPEEIQRIQELFQQGRPIRAIARTLGRNVKTIREVLGRPKKPKGPSRLEPFKPLIQELQEKQWRAPRILREIRSRGYKGSRTILSDYLRKIRGPRKPARTVVRRFETPAAADYVESEVMLSSHPEA